MPSSFKEEDEYGVRSGVEFAFMSTTTTRDVAMDYAKGEGGIVFEIEQVTD